VKKPGPKYFELKELSNKPSLCRIVNLSEAKYI
jgi:hypothetical protein